MRVKDLIEENLVTWLADRNVETIDDLKKSTDLLLEDLRKSNKKLISFETYLANDYRSWNSESDDPETLTINIDYLTIPKSSNFGHLSHSHGDQMEKQHRFELKLDDIKRMKRDILIESLLKEI